MFRTPWGCIFMGWSGMGIRSRPPSDTPDIDSETAKGHLVRPVSVFLLDYKGYTVQPEYSAEDGAFYGRLLGIRDFVDSQAGTASELESEFHKAVDDYLAFCKEIGKVPAKAGKREALPC